MAGKSVTVVLDRDSETEPLLPLRSDAQKPRTVHGYTLVIWIILVNLSLAATAAFALSWSSTWGPAKPTDKPLPFYAHIRKPQGLCHGKNGQGDSYAGYIGLDGDHQDRPKRSFFWYFEAQEDSQNAPIILTLGGGPGTSGMLIPLMAQSHCLVTSNGTAPNPNAWTERYNLLALDHPIGAGFSYGTMVNNSRAAAIDVYDFLQKFYRIYPHLVKNKLIISSGSYGGIYVPHIATVIHERNRAVDLGKDKSAAVRMNLDSLMISNPLSDAASHFRWWLHQACYNTNLYNSSTCAELFGILPHCLDRIQLAYEKPSVETRVTALDACRILRDGDTHGTMVENVSKKCVGSKEDCHPEFAWLSDFMNSATTKEQLGVPHNITFQTISRAVTVEFTRTGDMIQPAYLLYEPLLKDGIRLLHYVGAKDANCAWPGVFSFLKLLRSQYQERFINTTDVPWPSTAETSIRVVGEGAGVMTYILVDDAGHFVAGDQPDLTKDIVEHWIDNRPFV